MRGGNARLARLMAAHVALAAPLFLSLARPPIASADSSTATDSMGTVSDPKADAAADAAVKAAATALQKEFAAHLANSKTLLRTKPDFFTENKSPAVTAKAIVTALDHSYGSTASSVYVHWQLLSGIKETIEESLAHDLLNAYRGAPLPPERPGVDPSQKAQFTQAVAQMPETNEAKINTEFQQHVQDWETASKPFADYRDELAKHLPVNFDFVQAEFRDGIQRATVGVDADTVMQTAMKNGKSWALGQSTAIQVAQLSSEVKSLLIEMGATPAQINADAAVGSAGELPSDLLASANAEILAYAAPKMPANPKMSANSKTKVPEASFPPKYLTEVAWNDKSHSLQWKSGSAKFPTKEELIAFRKVLDEQQSSIKTKGAQGSNQSGTNQQSAN